ncbi:MAG: RagB/SusD family nutrient uptake outer membrane protein [Bacteroidales bacterium]|nr:RagB/SusD family nutrient uptake outer membrane protein [Bacteroidales bacterium]
MNKLKFIIASAALVFTLNSCDEFLSDAPSKSTSIEVTTIDHLEYMLNRYADFYQETNMTAMLSPDTYGLIKEMTDAKASMPGINPVQFATWDIEGCANYTRATTFSQEYSKIFRANMILSNLSSVSGDADRKAYLEKEAKFIKAYSMFNLVSTYCLPYTEANKGEMGMTLKNSTSFEELTSRATLEDTYKYIEENLEAALGITNDMTIVNNKYTHWRANKAAVNGFAARYWLQRGDYTKAYQYATTALESHNVLVNYNTDMYYSTTPSYKTVNGVKVEILYPYTHDNQTDLNDRMEWKELMYFRNAYYGSWYYIPSQKLLDSYDHDYDLRFKYHIVDNYSFDRGLAPYEYPGYVFFFKDNIPAGPTTAEMILIRAECLARQNKVSDAMTEVNKLREVRMDASAPADRKYLTASSQNEAVKVIIDERMREMPFTMRWFDIVRLNHNNDSTDDVGNLTRYYYPYTSAGVLTNDTPKTYTLEVGSRRYATPIPQTDITSSNGVIEQNKY